VRFIHAADIRLDSPLTGLSAYAGAPVETLRIATRDAFVNTKAWAEAQQKSDTIQASLTTETDRHRQLKSKSERLQRVRRLAPHLIGITP